MADGRYTDALRDYGAAYELTKDPVLFFKIGSANEKAGKCETAVVYFRRYLREAHPAENFVTLTKQRITACGGDANDTGPADAGSGSAGSGSGSAAVGSAGSGGGSDAGAGSAIVSTGSGSGSGSGSAAEPIKARHRVAWLLVGGSLTAITIGAVLAYSASAAEKDVDDIYIGFNGQPPVYDAKTEARYHELLDQGHRYEHLSWVSFGIAGALGAAAAVRFYFDSKSESLQIAPQIAPGTAGVQATVRF